MVLAERVRRLSGVCLLRLSTPVARSRAASTSWSRSRSCSCGSSRSFFRGACGCWRVCAWSGEYACVGVAEVAYGVDECPHGHRFPVGGLVVVEGYELADDVIWQVGIGRMVDDAPGVGVGG